MTPDPNADDAIPCLCLTSIPDMNCPLHGDVFSKVDGQETCEELEEAMKSSLAQLVSTPPADLEVLPCRAHGAAFVQVRILDDGLKLKVFEDGCEEHL